MFRIGNGSIFGALTILTTATQLKVGASDLTNRHTLIISNSAITDIFIGFDNSVTINNGLLVPEGTILKLELSVDNPVSIFAIASNDTEIRIAEVID